MTNTTPLVLTADPISTPTVLTLPDGVPVVQVRHRGVTLADLQELFDHGFGVLAGLGPVGPGFAAYDGDVSATFDLTLGFPVREVPADLPEGVEASVFPGGRALVVSHVGPFDGLSGAWQGLFDDPRARPAGTVLEVYVTDPSTSAPQDLRTDLVLPLA